jgi:hypothetical protein
MGAWRGGVYLVDFIEFEMPATQTAGLRIVEPVQLWVGSFNPWETSCFLA